MGTTLQNLLPAFLVVMITVLLYFQQFGILCAKFIYILCSLLTVYICTLFAFLSHLLFNTQSEWLLTALKSGIKLKQHSVKKN